VSVGASHPTPGPFSAGEETRRDLLAWSGSRNLLVPAGTVSTSPPSGGEAGESAADAARDGWAIPWEAVRWLLLRVMLAAAAGGVFAAIMRRISRIHPPTAEGLLGKDGFVTLGWVVFAIVLVGQLAFARGRPEPEGIDRSPPS
jgi:hypothetical protein